MSPLLGKRKQKTYHLALDLGTQYAKAAQFSIGEEGEVEVWGLGLNKQRDGAMEHGRVKHTARVAQVVENTIIEANRLDTYDNTSMIVGLSGADVKEHVTTAWHRRAKPQKKIKNKEWDDIVEHFRTQARDNAPDSDTDLRLAHSSFINTAIDEERVRSVVGQKGAYLEAQIFRTFAPKDHIQALTDISERVNLPITGTVSDAFATAQLIAGYYPRAGFLLVDVGSTSTVISRIEDGLIQQTTYFSIGGLSFTRRIAQELDTSLVEAESIKVQYSMARLSKKVSHKLAELLKEDIRMWLEGVEIGMQMLTRSRRDTLPPVVLLHGGGSNLIGIKEALEFDSWYEEVPCDHRPKVGLFRPNQLPVVSDYTGSASDPLYTNVLALASVAPTFNSS